MRKRIRKFRMISLLWVSGMLLMGSLCLMAVAPAPAPGVIVIVNEGNPVGDMTASQIRLTYLRKLSRRWKDFNKNILPVDRVGAPDAKRSFLADVLKMSPAEFDKYFSEREYQNQESVPMKFSSDEEVIHYVADNPGAIGYVADGTGIEAKKVKIIFRLDH